MIKNGFCVRHENTTNILNADIQLLHCQKMTNIWTPLSPLLAFVLFVNPSPFPECLQLYAIYKCDKKMFLQSKRSPCSNEQK